MGLFLREEEVVGGTEVKMAKYISQVTASITTSVDIICSISLEQLIKDLLLAR